MVYQKILTTTTSDSNDSRIFGDLQTFEDSDTVDDPDSIVIEICDSVQNYSLIY